MIFKENHFPIIFSIVCRKENVFLNSMGRWQGTGGDRGLGEGGGGRLVMVDGSGGCG